MRDGMKNLAAARKAGRLMLAALGLALFGGCNALTRLGLTDTFTVAMPAATLGVSHETLALAFSPNGKDLAVMQADLSEIQIWDWEKKRIVESLPIARGPNMRLSTRPIRYSPDGTLLAACLFQPDGSVAAQVWRTKDWAPAHYIDDSGHREGCNAIDFTRDGNSLLRLTEQSGDFDQYGMSVYDTRTWKLKSRIHIPGFHPYSISVSHDNKFVALGGEKPGGDSPEKQIVVLNLSDMTVARTISNNLTEHAGQIAFSTDDAYIAVTGPEGAEIFDAHTGKMVVNEKTGGYGALLRYCPDGQHLIESGADRAGDVTRIWDAEHRNALQNIAFKPSSMAVSRSGNYFALGDDQTIQIWQLR